MRWGPAEPLSGVWAILLAACWLAAGQAQGPQQLIEASLGQAAKTVVYAGFTLLRLNSGALCPLLAGRPQQLAAEAELEELRDPELSRAPAPDQPTLYVFSAGRDPDIAFRLFADDLARLDTALARRAGFQANQPTYLFVHGWLGGIESELWLSQAKRAALSAAGAPQGDFRPQVILVDWSRWARGSLFGATRQSYAVGRRLGQLLARLVRVAQLQPALMHCLGHSIGAHICGIGARLMRQHLDAQEAASWGGLDLGPPQAGLRRALEEQGFSKLARAPHSMGRVTGLDPGGFCYEPGVKQPTSYTGLKPDDAHLVDAYYSNRSPMGNSYQVASLNVRVNNAYLQRSCSVWLNSSMAAQYFRQSIKHLLGSSAGNDVLVCDHYYATQFAALAWGAAAGRGYAHTVAHAHALQASQQPLAHQPVHPIGAPNEASRRGRQPGCERAFIAYQCDSYANFVRGRCADCSSSSRACYSMAFEYQRGAPSRAHALQHLEDNALEPPDGVAYDSRRLYYMHSSALESGPNHCNDLFRVSALVGPAWRQLSVHLRPVFELWAPTRAMRDLSLLDPETAPPVPPEAMDEQVRLHPPPEVARAGPKAAQNQEAGEEDQEEDQSEYLWARAGSQQLTAMLEMLPAAGRALGEPTVRSIQSLELLVQARGGAADRAELAKLAKQLHWVRLEFVGSLNASERLRHSRTFTGAELNLAPF